MTKEERKERFLCGRLPKAEEDALRIECSSLKWLTLQQKFLARHEIYPPRKRP